MLQLVEHSHDLTGACFGIQQFDWPFAMKRAIGFAEPFSRIFIVLKHILRKRHHPRQAECPIRMNRPQSGGPARLLPVAGRARQPKQTQYLFGRSSERLSQAVDYARRQPLADQFTGRPFRRLAAGSALTQQFKGSYRTYRLRLL